jgi:hypothetical protein
VVEQLGLARKVTVAGSNTVLIADSASRDEIDMRVAQVRGQEGQGRWFCQLPGLWCDFL